MGWSQWGLFKFVNKTYDHTLKLKFPDTAKHWGWPFEDNGNVNTRNRIQYSEIESKDITPQTSYSYGQTGKQNEWAGMEGTVQVHVKGDNGPADKICKVFYNCPFSGNNDFRISEVKDGWKVDSWGADYNGNALGSVTIDIRKT